MKIMHFPQTPWLFSSRPDRFTIRTWTDIQTFSSVSVLCSDPYDYLPGEGKRLPWKEYAMERIETLPEYEVWSCEVPVPTRKFTYLFHMTDGENRDMWFGREGISEDRGRAEGFRTGYRYDEDKLPSWTGKSVWYQIFPDRYAGGKQEEPFCPTRTNFWNGTLDGICGRIPYLKSLGITGVYLNPVFSSPSNHRYDTLDYSLVDEKLGTNESLLCLADQLHRNGLRLMMDGVYNHASSQCPFFQDVKRNGKQSPYYDWFMVFDPEALMKEPESNFTPERMKKNPPYECFGFAANMPKWNTDHPEVQDYLIHQAEIWTRKLNLDAWRLDVPDEVSPSFLRTFRRRMRMINPEILIIGEIWTDPWPWTQTGLFDGTMDYLLYNAVSGFIFRSSMNAEEFCNSLRRRQTILTPEILKNQMLFIGNHDLPRCLTLAGGNIEKIKAAWLFLCMLDGEVNLYYGDEFAMTGGEDPANRGVMQWKTDPEAVEMHGFIRQTIALRKQMLSFPVTDVRFVALSSDTVRAEITRGEDQYVLIMSNDTTGTLQGAKAEGALILSGGSFRLWHMCR